MIPPTTKPTPRAVAHSEPSDSCAGCQHRAIVGKTPAAWRYCTLHVTPFSRCAHYDVGGATVPTDRFAGGLRCK